MGSVTDIYLLDRETGVIVRMLPDGKVLNKTGGIGQDDISFSDPVDISVSNLNILVSDRMENRITWFDRKLEYISTEKHGDIYPAQLVADESGIIYLLSKEQGVVWRRNFNQWDSQEYIDLMQFDESPECIEDMAIKRNGNLGLLYCDGTLLEFNPLGKLYRTFPKILPNAKYIEKYKNTWLIFSPDGHYTNTESALSPGSELPVQDIIDLTVVDNQIYLLSPTGIHVFSE